MSFEGGDALLPTGFLFPSHSRVERKSSVHDGVTEIAGPSAGCGANGGLRQLADQGTFLQSSPLSACSLRVDARESPSMHRATMCLHFRASAARSPGHYLMVFDIGRKLMGQVQLNISTFQHIHHVFLCKWFPSFDDRYCRRFCNL